MYPQEVLADEEPKYLRRQKPLEIKRRKFGRKAWKTYLHVTAWTAMGLAPHAAPNRADMPTANEFGS